MQPIFSRNEDFTKIAFMNWRVEQDGDILSLFNIADGFLMSSMELCKTCLINNKGHRADVIIFPILTNVNHGIELYLKGMTAILNILLERGFKVEGRHNIKQIYQTVRSKIKEYKGGLSIKDFDKETIALKAFIEELYLKTGATDKDDKMDFSRYPFNNKNEDHFYVLPMGRGVIEIDLENLLTRVEIIMKSLKQIAEFLYHHELAQTNYFEEDDNLDLE